MLSFLAGPLGTVRSAAPSQLYAAERSCRAQPGLVSNISHSCPWAVYLGELSAWPGNNG